MTDPVQLPPWAGGMADLHAHAWPSLLPRHRDDRGTVASENAVGFSTVVLKSHEGSTAERAALAGDGVYGGIVLNSPVGGANPDAVEVAARLGGRVVWMPTVSARAHKASAASPELAVHRSFDLQAVDVVSETGQLLPQWNDVLDVVAAHDLLLASGHLEMTEALVLFGEARRRGVQRLLVNHPLMAFQRWREELTGELLALDVRLELGILPDLINDPDASSLTLARCYPASMLVFGGDLGHSDFATPETGVAPWLHALDRTVGSTAARAIMTSQTRDLLL